MGKMKNVQVKLHIDGTGTPVKQQYRRVPLRQKVEELNRLDKAILL